MSKRTTPTGWPLPVSPKADPYANLSTRVTPQSEQADSRQVKNNAGGFTFTLDPLARLRRFLILGTEGGTYYVSEGKHTVQGFEAVKAAFAHSPQEALDLVYTVSHEGLAHKQAPTLVAFAYACSYEPTKVRALEMLPKICRTGTMLFQWWTYVNQFRGLGRGLKTATRRWYTERDLGSLANQIVKYQQREGVSHRKLLGLTRPRPRSEEERAVYGFAVGKGTNMPTGTVLDGYHAAHGWNGDVATLIRAIEEFRLTHEMLPSESLKLPEVWRALVPHMGLTALIRNLGRMTAIGVFQDPTTLSFVLGRLGNEHEYRSARVHPMAVLLAARTYAAGRGFKGQTTWMVNGRIVEALDKGFRFAFANVEPTGKRRLLALDISGSMSSSIGGTFLSCREATAAMAQVTLAVEGANTAIVGFAAGTTEARYRPWDTGNTVLTDLGGLVLPSASLSTIVNNINGLPFGGTDCALPMVWATQNKLAFDSFEIYTDNETWAGNVHPHQALVKYREQSGIDARMVVVGMTATNFTIADPSDPGMLDVVGFDASAPAAIADFVAGRV